MRQPHDLPPDAPVPAVPDVCQYCQQPLQVGQTVLYLEQGKIHEGCHYRVGDLGIVRGNTGVSVIAGVHGAALEVRDSQGRPAFVARQGFIPLAHATAEQLKAAGVKQ